MPAAAPRVPRRDVRAGGTVAFLRDVHVARREVAVTSMGRCSSRHHEAFAESGQEVFV
jgi:hypothetical protein